VAVNVVDARPPSALAADDLHSGTGGSRLEEPDVCLRQAQAYQLVDAPGDGVELFSSLRDCALPHLAAGVSDAEVHT
jgi:hypothetical protein